MCMTTHNTYTGGREGGRVGGRKDGRMGGYLAQLDVVRLLLGLVQEKALAKGERQKVRAGREERRGEERGEEKERRERSGWRGEKRQGGHCRARGALTSPHGLVLSGSETRRCTRILCVGCEGSIRLARPPCVTTRFAAFFHVDWDFSTAAADSSSNSPSSTSSSALLDPLCSIAAHCSDHD